MVEKPANLHPHEIQAGGMKPARIGALPLPLPGAVDVWAVPLKGSAEELELLKKTLSPGELERAARFHFEEHQTRFIVGHGRLRQLLAGYLSLPARSIEFSSGKNGKPGLAGKAGASGLEFNFTHSGEQALVALAAQPVGIDLELIRPISDANELVQRFFSKREATAFALLPEGQKPLGFFQLWTRKEAWLKATGEGITHLLDQVEVSFLPGEPARLLHLPDEWSGELNWRLCHLEPEPDYVGALAIALKQPEVRLLRWRDLPGEFV